MGHARVVRAVCLVAALCVVTAVASYSQTFETLVTFDWTDGAFPSALIQGADGNLYGTAAGGGTDGGTAFKIGPDGQIKTLHSFCSQTNCPDGVSVLAGLVQSTNGNFYGTTYAGGASNSGTVFEVTSSGKFTTLYSFCAQSLCTDGYEPYAGSLVQGANGDFYGTTYRGGAGTFGGTAGTIFKITSAGKLTTLYSFCSQPGCSDGAGPWAGLVQATNGDFYGTTYWGGSMYSGTIFRLSQSGRLSTLYSFCSQSRCSDGAYPTGGLVQGTDGNLYGTTSGPGNGGTVFKITTTGTLTTLYHFCSFYGCPDGSIPMAGLVQGTDGNLYGTTSEGGVAAYGCGGLHLYGCGSIFRITRSGKLTKLYDFCSQSGCTDGALPQSVLMQGTDGNFYGSTNDGGNSDTNCIFSGTLGCGTVFRFSLGLRRSVRTNPAFGAPSRKVGILGNSLTGATAVTFAGTPATFTVVSDTLIEATVPTGATTGIIQVTTPSRTLNSNVAFQVLP